MKKNKELLLRPERYRQKMMDRTRTRKQKWEEKQFYRYFILQAESHTKILEHGFGEGTVGGKLICF